MNKKADAEPMVRILLVLIILAVVCVVIFFIVYGIKYSFTSGEEIITVDTKWTKIVDGTEKYRITATNGQVYVIQDSLIHKQFESASIYAVMKDGETYKITTQGFRFGFFSDFKKIVKATKI